jgi:charged multivesicular body protein 5
VTQLENKVRELSETVTKLDNEAKDLLEKSKKAKGTTKEMYKQRCVNILKKRKQYDNQLKAYMNQQFTLDQVAFTSENIQNTIEMVTIP